jgi:hypothetical protein
MVFWEGHASPCSCPKYSAGHRVKGAHRVRGTSPGSPLTGDRIQGFGWREKRGGVKAQLMHVQIQ